MTQMDFVTTNVTPWAETQSPTQQPNNLVLVTKLLELQKKISCHPALSNHEQQVLTKMAQTFMEGNLKCFQNCMQQADNPNQIVQLLNIFSEIVCHPGIAFDNAIIGNLACSDTCYHDVVFWSVTLINAQRRLSLTSNTRYGTCVYGPSGDKAFGLTKELAEDPALLFVQITHLAAISPHPFPPPLSSN